MDGLIGNQFVLLHVRKSTVHVYFHRQGVTGLTECCDFGENCVLLGTGESTLSIFPREAASPGNPYPIGLDPVSAHYTCMNK